METKDITRKFKILLVFVLIVPTAIAAGIGNIFFKHYHTPEEIQISNAKVTGTTISVRTRVDGKISELIFKDGEEVKAGDVIARLEVDVNAETIAQLEDTLEMAKENFETLKLGQIVKVPVKKIRPVTQPAISNTPPPNKSSELASLEERANRMKELYEMGAVSKVQMDAAISAYEKAKGANVSSTPPATANNMPTFVEEIEYIDQWQPTPAPALQNAENAVKQAELSLNVARQEAQETEVIAPVNGTIYYVTEILNEVTAGDTIARVGNSNELWLSAEVSKDTFNKIDLGLPVDYILEGYNLSGTVIEKLEPNLTKDPTEKENLPEWIPPTSENEHPEIILMRKIEAQKNERPNDKYILKFSIPFEREFEYNPNAKASVKVKIY